MCLIFVSAIFLLFWFSLTFGCYPSYFPLFWNCSLNSTLIFNLPTWKDKGHQIFTSNPLITVSMLFPKLLYFIAWVIIISAFALYSQNSFWFPCTVYPIWHFVSSSNIIFSLPKVHSLMFLCKSESTLTLSAFWWIFSLCQILQ